MPGVLLWGWDSTNKKWIPVLVNASGKLELASLEDAEISQATPEDMTHVPHGYYAGGPSYLPFAVDSAGKLQLAISTLEHLNDITDVNAPSPSDNDALTWDTATSKWIPEARLANIVEDTTPQLGGDLNCQSKKLTSLLGNLFKTATELTIATGVITVTQALHTVDTEGDAASDDLATINGGATINMIVIKAANAARTVVVKHNTGNIWLQGKADISLDDLEDGLLLVWSGTKWFDIAAGGAAGVTTKIQDADGDTSWDTEQSADEDKIHGKVAGVEAFLLSAAGELTLAKQSSCSVYLNTQQNDITHATFTKVLLDAEDYDTQNEFSTANKKFTAAEAGTYLVTAVIDYINYVADKAYLAALYVNGARVKADRRYSSTNVGGMPALVTTCLQLAANDYVELYAYHEAGVDTVDIYPGLEFTWMVIHKLS